MTEICSSSGDQFGVLHSQGLMYFLSNTPNLYCFDFNDYITKFAPCFWVFTACRGNEVAAFVLCYIACFIAISFINPVFTFSFINSRKQEIK